MADLPMKVDHDDLSKGVRWISSERWSSEGLGTFIKFLLFTVVCRDLKYIIHICLDTEQILWEVGI
jgi:hypothetical protein